MRQPATGREEKEKERKEQEKEEKDLKREKVKGGGDKRIEKRKELGNGIEQAQYLLNQTRKGINNTSMNSLSLTCAENLLCSRHSEGREIRRSLPCSSHSSREDGR